MDDSDLDALLLCSQLQVIVRRGPEEHNVGWQQQWGWPSAMQHTRQPPVLPSSQWRGMRCGPWQTRRQCACILLDLLSWTKCAPASGTPALPRVPGMRGHSTAGISPKGVAHDQEGHILLLSSCQDGLRLLLMCRLLLLRRRRCQ